ncbi:hypothetical protein T09_11818 [Trichinella sp. T9]|nr:hypothetical protein T09_11818 [Trichinella sp. T9]
MDNDLMLNNRLKECGTEKIVTLKDVTYEALLSFHDESKEFQDDFRLECKEIEILVKVNHVCSEDHLSPLSEEMIQTIGGKYENLRLIRGGMWIAGKYDDYRIGKCKKLWKLQVSIRISGGIKEVMGILRMREEKVRESRLISKLPEA